MTAPERPAPNLELLRHLARHVPQDRSQRRDLARVVGQASASERRLAETRAKSAAADCEDFEKSPAITGDAP
jgi:hypothetical protein